MLPVAVPATTPYAESVPATLMAAVAEAWPTGRRWGRAASRSSSLCALQLGVAMDEYLWPARNVAEFAYLPAPLGAVALEPGNVVPSGLMKPGPRSAIPYPAQHRDARRPPTRRDRLTHGAASTNVANQTDRAAELFRERISCRYQVGKQ